MSTLADRVNRRMGDLKMRQIDVARLTKVAPASVAQWRNGHTKTLSGDVLLRAAVVLQCLPTWLATGHGSMVAESGITKSAVEEPAPSAAGVFGARLGRSTAKWPFRKISLEKIETLSQEDARELEGAWRTAAKQLGIDVELAFTANRKKA